MSRSKWMVSIISTALDLRDLRSSLTAKIRNLGFGVQVFEDPDFPVEPGVNAHDACLLAIQHADIVILVIDKRYGSPYRGSGPESITEKEYDTACAKGKIIIPCIRKDLWDENACLEHIEKQWKNDSDLADMEIRKKLSPNYAEDWRVLDFVRKVRDADTDNWVVTYDPSEELGEKVIERFPRLSRHISERIVAAQIEAVKQMKTTTGTILSLGDVLDQGYFLEPEYEVQSGSVEPGLSASDVIYGFDRKRRGMAIYGDAGSGKSTLVAKAFLKRAAEALEAKTANLPFFISLRGIGSDYSFHLEEYIQQCINEFLGKEAFPSLVLDKVEPIFFMDGLDELTEDVASIDLNRISNSQMFSCPFVISCRSRFASRSIDASLTMGNKLSVIIKLMPWDRDKAKQYINHFCDVRKHPELLPVLESTISDEIMRNPLLLTLYLWIVAEGDLKLPLNIHDQVPLNDKCLELWANRELARTGQDGTPVSAEQTKLLCRAWRLGAWEIYRSRFDVPDPIAIDELFDHVQHSAPMIEQVCTIEMFSALLDIRGPTNKVNGFIHEQLLEHLVAEILVEGMATNCTPFPDCLNYVIRPEIHRTVRWIWENKGQPEEDMELSETVKNLWSAYEKVLYEKDGRSLMRRDLAVYYLGQILTTTALLKLEAADKLESEVFVKLSIGFSLIKRGHFEKEEHLFEMLKDNEDWDKTNRGFHLVYYKDWPVKDQTAPYLDPENIPWEGTLTALLRHIESRELRHVALRRIELYTIRRFLETRHSSGPLSDSVKKRLEDGIAAMENLPELNLPSEFLPRVREEYDALIKTWNSLEG